VIAAPRPNIKVGVIWRPVSAAPDAAIPGRRPSLLPAQPAPQPRSRRRRLQQHALRRRRPLVSAPARWPKATPKPHPLSADTLRHRIVLVVQPPFLETRLARRAAGLPIRQSAQTRRPSPAPQPLRCSSHFTPRCWPSRPQQLSLVTFCCRSSLSFVACPRVAAPDVCFSLALICRRRPTPPSPTHPPRLPRRGRHDLSLIEPVLLVL